MDVGSGTNRRQVEDSPAVPQHLTLDKIYKAVQPLFKHKEESERRRLVELLNYCYTEHGRGFKDTHSMFEYYYKLEDGIPLCELVITEEHLVTPNLAGASEIIPEGTPSQSLSLLNGHIEPASNLSRSAMPSTPDAVDTGSTSSSRLNPELTCKVCLDAAVAVTFVPCGHLVTCRNCALSLVECPVCRTVIRGTVSTFF